MIDIRRAIEAIVPDALWDFSVPNEGGTEAQYNNIRWSDPRQKPSWADIVSTASGFAEADAAAARQFMQCSPLQMRRALRQVGMYQQVVDWVAAQDDEIADGWEYASYFARMDPFIIAASHALSKTDEEMDSLFTLAASS